VVGLFTAREYLRVSQDRSGRARSNDEQHDDNVRAGQEFGFTLNGEAYSDVSLYASRFATKRRGDFARLLADLEGGRFGADVLVLWEPARGSRKVSEWCQLIEAAEAAGVKIHVTTAERTFDPANAHDVKNLINEANDAQYDSGKKSVAIRRAAAATAARGEPHGRIPYGYARRYDPVTRRLIAQEPREDEAAVVAELFHRLNAGHSLKSIERDFATWGIRTRTGKLFDSQHLRDLALRPLYAGLRIHTPGNRTGRYRGSLVHAVQATWPALVDREVFFAVRNLLQSPERRTTRPGRGKHLLSLIAICDPSGGPLSVTYRRGYREYSCRNFSHVYITADDLDGYAEQVMLAYLGRPDVIERLRATPDDGGELAGVRGDLAQARGELASWRAAAGTGKVSVESFIAIEPRLLGRIEGLEARERELSTPPALSVIPPGQDVARRWAAAPMSARRTVARLLLSPPILGTLRLARSPSPGHQVDPEDRIVWDRTT
jgi:DNA invertase Pin-like site-specific DNA recombinase